MAMAFLKYDCFIYKVKYSSLCMSSNSNTDDYNSEEIVKKEARGLAMILIWVKSKRF
jgi:hypothetical protein